METINDLGQYTFPALLANSVKKFGDRPALALVGQKEDTYLDVKEHSETIGKALCALGLKKGDKVALYGTGRPQWGEAYFGIVNYGLITVPLLPDFSETEVKSIIEHCGVDALIVESKLYEKIKKIKDSLPKYIIKLEDLTFISGGEGSFDQYKDLPLPEVEVNEDDTASIIYTSGTTGRSKGVELTHKNLVWTAIGGQTCHRVNKMDRCLSFLPLSHVYEFTIGFLMQMLNGSCVYYLGKPPVVSALLPAFQKVQPTIVISVPLIMEKIYKNKVLPALQKNNFVKFLCKFTLIRKKLHRVAGKELKKTFGGKLIFFGVGGAKIDPQVEVFMKNAKFPYASGYGLTETSPLLAGIGPQYSAVGCIGPVIPGLDLRILNPDPKTGVGEIVVKGPNVMVGYYKEPELTKAAFTTEEDSCGAGYFKTGDLGLFERHHRMQYLALKGRSKNMILGPSGENIYPEDIEFVLNQHPLVSESLVIEDTNGLTALVQVDDEKLTQEAEKRSLMDHFASLTESVARSQADFVRDVQYQKEALLNEIQFFVNSKVNKSSKIDKIEQVPEFEKTASQKIKRYLYNRKPTDKKKKK